MLIAQSKDLTPEAITDVGVVVSRRIFGEVAILHAVEIGPI